MFSKKDTTFGDYTEYPDTILALTGVNIILDTNGANPPLVTITSDDAATLTTDDVYYLAFGGEKWIMYTYPNLQLGGGANDTAMYSHWHAVPPGATVPPMPSPYSRLISYENKWGMYWGTYFEPGWTRTDNLEVTNTTMNGVTIQ